MRFAFKGLGANPDDPEAHFGLFMIATAVLVPVWALVGVLWFVGLGVRGGIRYAFAFLTERALHFGLVALLLYGVAVLMLGGRSAYAYVAFALFAIAVLIMRQFEFRFAVGF